MEVKISQAVSMITTAIKCGLVPMIEGSPGMGKSEIVQQIAKSYGLKLIDLRLSQCDPTDLLGFPTIGTNIDPTKARAGYVPMDTFPLENDTIPQGYNGWLIFMDEFSSAMRAVQAAAYKIVLDRKVGQQSLHKNVAIVCAGNKETDNAIVEPMSTALQSRLVHMELVVDAEEWLQWAASNKVDHRITSYVGWKPDALYSFQADHTDKTYACPRTWEFANRLLKNISTLDKDALPLLAGTLSEGIAREFLAYCKVQDKLPKLSQIMAAPETLEVPQDLSTVWALSGFLASQMNEANCAVLLKYIQRFAIENQVFCLRDTTRRNPALKKHPALLAWVIHNSLEIN